MNNNIESNTYLSVENMTNKGIVFKVKAARGTFQVFCGQGFIWGSDQMILRVKEIEIIPEEIMKLKNEIKRLKKKVNRLIKK